MATVIIEQIIPFILALKVTLVFISVCIVFTIISSFSSYRQGSSYEQSLISNIYKMIRIIGFLVLSAAVRSTIIITSPAVTPFSDNSLPYFYTNFGEVPYGKSMTYHLKILDQSICELGTLTHLEAPTYLAVKVTALDQCSIPKMAINAQSIGAKGLLVASVVADSQRYTQNNVIPSDDGNGKRVHITALHITTTDLQKLKTLSEVEIVAKYPVPKQTISTLHIYISAAERSTYIFLRQLQKDYSSLRNHMQIDLIYHTMDCSFCDPLNCIGPTHCAYDNEHFQPQMGEKIIREQLHQYNIFKFKGADVWFEYMSLFDQFCDYNWNQAEACSQTISKQLGLTNVAKTHPVDTMNEWRSRSTKLGLQGVPEVAVNSMVYRGNFVEQGIREAVCASLIDPPEYCKNPEKSQGGEQSGDNSPNNHVILILVCSMLGLGTAIGVSVCLYKRFVKGELTRDMSSRVGQLVATYANRVSSQKKKQRDRLIESQAEQL